MLNQHSQQATRNKGVEVTDAILGTMRPWDPLQTSTHRTRQHALISGDQILPISTHRCNYHYLLAKQACGVSSNTLLAALSLIHTTARHHHPDQVPSTIHTPYTPRTYYPSPSPAASSQHPSQSSAWRVQRCHTRESWVYSSFHTL